MRLKFVYTTEWRARSKILYAKIYKKAQKQDDSRNILFGKTVSATEVLDIDFGIVDD